MKCSGTSSPSSAKIQSQSSAVSCGRVVEAGDQEVGDLKPNIGFAAQPAQHVEHRGEVRERDLAVEVFGEPLEVDVGGVDVLVDIEEGLAGDVSVGDHDGVESGAVGGLGDVDDELRPDGGLVVSKGDGGRAALDGKIDDLLRRHVGGALLHGAGFADVEVLAELATEVAARSAQREDVRAGMEVEERLLFDGIDGEGGGASVAELHQFAVDVLADEAEAVLAGPDVAVARTEIAVDASVGERLPPARGMESGGHSVTPGATQL